MLFSNGHHHLVIVEVGGCLQTAKEKKCCIQDRCPSKLSHVYYSFYFQSKAKKKRFLNAFLQGHDDDSAEDLAQLFSHILHL